MTFLASRLVIAVAFLWPLLSWSASFGIEPQFHTRAIWVPPHAFATRAAVDKMIDRCHRAGFNVLLPNVMVNQAISFRSANFPGRVDANDKFDPLAYVVDRAHAMGMKVEAWCCVYYEGTRTDSIPPLHPEWLVQSMSGESFEQDFLSPSRPAVNAYLLPILKDLLAYEIDGIHLDYIRFPGTTFDYSEVSRKEFEASAGFDPMDLLDHAERIIESAEEPYPVRVLFPREHQRKAWETTSIERTLDQVGLGFAFVSESPDNMAKLPAPGLLIVSSYYDVPPAMVDAISDFVARGGDLLWTDVPASALAKSPDLRRLLGLNGATWKGAGRITLTPVNNHPLGVALATDRFVTTSSFDPQPSSAVVVARNCDGSPAVLVNDSGGKVVVCAFHLMKSTSHAVASIAKSTVSWLRTRASVPPGDPLAEKRAAWVAWRADRVTALVREVHAACQRHDPTVTVSSSGGPSPVELYACYRDARRWLVEGINDHVFPMNYTEDPEVLCDILDVQKAWTPASAGNSVFPGLQTYARRERNGRLKVEPLDAAVVQRQLEIVRQRGYRGYALFAYNRMGEETFEMIRQMNGVE